jgi:hypothetical protein
MLKRMQEQKPFVSFDTLEDDFAEHEVRAVNLSDFSRPRERRPRASTERAKPRSVSLKWH